GNNWTDNNHAQQHQQGTDDAHREVVDQELETNWHAGFHPLVKFLQDPGRKGTHDHSAEQHWDGSSNNGTHGRESTHDTTALTVDHVTRSVADQDRQKIDENWTNKRCKSFIRNPTCRTELGCDEPPGDEGAEVWNNHRSHKTAVLLDFFFHDFSLIYLLVTKN